MDKSDRKIKRVLLKPLFSTRRSADNKNELLKALIRLERRAISTNNIRELRTSASELQKRVPKNVADEENVSTWTNLAKNIYQAGLMSTQEYVFFVSIHIEKLHESRVFNNKYEDLNKITKSLRRIEKKHGLGPDEYWFKGQGPDEHNKLNKDYDIADRTRLIATFKEFEFQDLADILESNPDEYHRLRERGRRAVYHASEPLHALKDLVARYEDEARKAAASKAYLAAVTSLGAGVEGLLLNRCLLSPQKTQKIATRLSKRHKPRLPEDPTTWNFDTLIEVCLQAGWLPPISTNIAQFNSASLANELRLMRNYVHPGRYIREKPWIETDEEDYQNAEAVYFLLSAILNKQISSRTRKHD